MKKFPGFKKCMAMMNNRDPQLQENGFHWLEPHAREHVYELMEAFHKEEKHGLRCWLLELIGSAKSTAAFELFAAQLRSDDERLRYWAIRGLKNLNTKEARTLLFEARSFSFGTPEQNLAFRDDLDRVLNNQN